MELKNTTEMMNSEDYKERFKAEYYQLKIRYEKLENMVYQHDVGTLPFVLTCPIMLLKHQMEHMGNYLTTIEKRAVIECIDLDTTSDYDLD